VWCSTAAFGLSLRGSVAFELEAMPAWSAIFCGGWRWAVCVGVSLRAGVSALWLAGRHPELDGLVLMQAPDWSRSCTGSMGAIREHSRAALPRADSAAPVAAKACRDVYRLRWGGGTAGQFHADDGMRFDHGAGSAWLPLFNDT